MPRSISCTKRFPGTLGHRETTEPVCSENAWGEMASTAVPAMVDQQVISWNQEPPVLSPGECQLDEQVSVISLIIEQNCYLSRRRKTYGLYPMPSSSCRSP